MDQESQVVGVRFSKDRVDKIESRAEEEGINKSEFIRDAVRRELGETLLKDRVSRLEEIVEDQLQIDPEQW